MCTVPATPGRCHFVTILERLEFKNFSCRPTMVASNTFQCSIDPQLWNPFALCVIDHFPFWHFLRHPHIKKRKLRCEGAREKINILLTNRSIEEKMINYPFKGLSKTMCYKQSPTFPSFSVIIVCCWAFISFLVKAVKYIYKIWKINKISLSSFHNM